MFFVFSTQRDLEVKELLPILIVQTVRGQKKVGNTIQGNKTGYQKTKLCFTIILET